MTLYSLAIFSSAVFGFDINHVIVALGMIVLVYSVSGGSWAIMATDFIQCLIMFVMTILLTGLCLIKVGGIGGLFELIQAHGLASDYAVINDPERFHRSFTWLWAGAIFLRVIFVQNTLGAAPRYFSVKNGREARKAALLGMFLMLIGTCIWFIPPMTARLFYSTAVDAMPISKPAESSFAIACLNLFPPGMVGLMVVAMFAASMSSMDTGLNKNAAIFIINVYPVLKKFFKFPELAPKKMLFMSRIFSSLFGVIGIVCALLFAAISGLGQFELVLLVGALLSLPMGIPLFWGILFKKTPPWAAGFSISMGFVASVAAQFSEQFFGTAMCYYEKAFLVAGVSTLAFFITLPFARFNNPEYDGKVDEFFKIMETPVDFEKEVGEANDPSQLKIIGYFTSAMGLMITLLIIPATDKLGVICPLFIGGVIALLGLLLVYVGHRPALKTR